jgi:hypothetical protein
LGSPVQRPLLARIHRGGRAVLSGPERRMTCWAPTASMIAMCSGPGARDGCWVGGYRPRRRWGRSCGRSPSGMSVSLTIEIRHALEVHPYGPTFRSLFIAADSWLCAATMIAEIGDCRERYPAYRARRRRWPSPRRRRIGQKPNTRNSAGPATTDYAKRSAPSPTQAAATTHGRLIFMTAPDRAVPVTPTPPASSVVPGARSSGASGTTTPPTTLTNTPPFNA